MATQTPAPGGVTLFYDADCGVCSWLALRAVRAAPPCTVRALPIDSTEAEPQMGKLGDEARWASWHILGEDGRLRSGGAAAPVLLEQLPHTRPLVRLLRATPRATERLYRLGAATRSLWGRLVPRRSVARARRELAVLTTHSQSKRGAQCRTIL
ncbi:MAG TPA: DCC1-like thiol-disulfide oxidoreductase family protein [Solirubrobacteraceae bacterium]|nr:DCC1-like thiol-disulfide oxidoreductase family protein [Solirubrobacteraceae bacterium]